MPDHKVNFELPLREITLFCQRHRVSKLSLFGSVLRDDFGPDCDIDILIEFEPGKRAGFLTLTGMEVELTEIIGRKVDLRTAAELGASYRQEIVDTALVQYEQKSGPKTNSSEIPALQRIIQSIRS